ncbi:MAG TPA: hypothetical protein VEW46_10670 [Pyrinomonadaceae bacterium]|nr:hypothetical protein [Pyrinomonadaceae bacterium]
MPDNRISLHEFLLLATVVTALTLGAAWVYPIWDDARLIVLIRESGNGAILANIDSRLLVSRFLIFLSDHRVFLPVGLAVHWIAWLGMGLVTMRLWRVLFPGRARFALLPGLLSVAPILCKVQLVIVTVVFIVLIGPVLIYLAILMFTSEHPSPRRKIVADAAGLVLIILSILLSEYGVSAAAVAFTLVTAKAFNERGELRRGPRTLAMLIAVSSLASYIAFYVLARSTVSPPYRPGFALQSLPRKIQTLPFDLLSGLWRGTIGAFLEALGSITLNTKATLLSFVCGAIFSAVVALGVYRKAESPPAPNREWLSVLTLLVATLVAIFPVLLMGRDMESKWDSRFWLPVLPVVSSLTVFILLSVVRARLWLLVPIVCGFLAGYWTTLEIIDTRQHPEPVFAAPPEMKTGLSSRSVIGTIFGQRASSNSVE